MTESELLASVSEGGSKGYVPDIVVHGFPYWFSVEQIRQVFQECGQPNISAFKMSMDDRSGVFTGAVLVRLPSAIAALQFSEAVHGKKVLKEDEEEEEEEEGEREGESGVPPLQEDGETLGRRDGGGLHNSGTLVSGVLTPSMEIVSLWSGKVRMGVGKENGKSDATPWKGGTFKNGAASSSRSATVNERLWL